MMIKKIFFINLFISLSFFYSFSQNLKTSNESFKTIINDDPLLEMIDSLAVSKHLQCNIQNQISFNKYHFSPDSIPIYTENDYKDRISFLHANLCFPYSYNKLVKDYIELFAYKKRQYVSQWLGLSQLYFPLFEKMLDKYKLPLELKYLAVVESALNPFAHSRNGAVGIWQFMYENCKTYDLEVNSLVDERYDIYKETKAACEILQDYYNIYGDWQLA